MSNTVVATTKTSHKSSSTIDIPVSSPERNRIISKEDIMLTSPNCVSARELDVRQGSRRSFKSLSFRSTTSNVISLKDCHDDNDGDDDDNDNTWNAADAGGGPDASSQESRTLTNSTDPEKLLSEETKEIDNRRNRIVSTIPSPIPSVSQRDTYELPLCISYLSLVLPSFGTAAATNDVYVADELFLSSKNDCSHTVSTVLTDGEEDVTSGAGISDIMSASTNGQTSLAKDRLKETIRCAANVQLLRTGSKSESNPQTQEDETKMEKTRIPVNLNIVLKSNQYEIASISKQYILAHQYEEAIDIYRTVLQAYREQHGPHHPLVISTLHNLSVTNIWNGNYNEAFCYCREALRIRRKEYGPGHLSVALSLSDMGMIYYAREEFSRSLRSLREALQISCKALGYDHPSVARILNNIGCVHFSTGKLIAAIATFEESLDIQRSSMGGVSSKEADSVLIDVSTTICNLGMVSAKRRQFESAICLLEEGLMVQESVLGDVHRMVLGTTEILETLRDDVVGSRLDDKHPTKERHRIVISTKTSSLEKNRDTRMNFNGNDNKNMKENGSEGVCSISEKTYSVGLSQRRNHCVSSRSIHGDFDSLHIDLLDIGPLQDEWNAQERVINSVIAPLSASRNAFTPPENNLKRKMSDSCKRFLTKIQNGEKISSPDYVVQIYEQAIEHVERRKFEEALNLFERVLTLVKEEYGEVHDMVGTAHNNIGIMHLLAENYGQALPEFQEAVSIRTAALGPDHPDVSASLVKAAITMFALGDYDNTLVSLCQALRLKRKNLGYSNTDAAIILNNIGVCHYEFGGLLSALKSFEESLEIQQEANQNTNGSGENMEISIPLATILDNLGFIHCKRNNYAEAIVVFEKSLDIRRKIYGKNHNITNNSLKNLAHAMASVNSKDDACGFTEMTAMYIDMLGN